MILSPWPHHLQSDASMDLMQVINEASAVHDNLVWYFYHTNHSFAASTNVIITTYEGSLIKEKENLIVVQTPQPMSIKETGFLPEMRASHSIITQLN